MHRITCLTASLVWLMCPALALAEQSVLRLEAEDAVLAGLETATDRGGFSGSGYVRGFDQDDDRLEFRFTAEAGLYELRIGYACLSGDKGYALEVNAEKSSGMFIRRGDGFAVHNAGKLRLTEGRNTVAIGKGWGWFEIDYIELHPAAVRVPAKPPKKLADPDADPEARALMSCLVDLYGRKTLAGQQDMAEIAYVHEVTGRTPAVGSFDLMDYSPSRLQHGAEPGQLVEDVIGWARGGGSFVSLCWHWNAPAHLIDQKGGKEWWRGFYTKATTYNVEAALADTASMEYRLLLRDLDAIAVQLRKFRVAGVPVLWRPLHEAQGGWFWWGARGPDALVKLWRLMFKRFVHRHGLHHLIWVYSPPAGGIQAADWYPGDAYVDVVGVDIYTDASSSMSGEWEALQEVYGGRKLVALSESGTLPHPDRMRTYQVWWSWFSVWSGKFVRDLPKETVRLVYEDGDIITQDELPALIQSAASGSGLPGLKGFPERRKGSK